jgi:hypothetical protein
VAEKTHTDDAGEQFDVNPDGADLDGTAEIERQQAERERGSGSPPSAGESPAATDDDRGTPKRSR